MDQRFYFSYFILPLKQDQVLVEYQVLTPFLVTLDLIFPSQKYMRKIANMKIIWLYYILVNNHNRNWAHTQLFFVEVQIVKRKKHGVQALLISRPGHCHKQMQQNYDLQNNYYYRTLSCFYENF